jgi:hypothetical protein
MSFLDSSNSEFLSARITRKGRKSIAEGNFVIKYFQVGDSEFDYMFSGFTGAGSTPRQRVLAPMDGDQHIKYPYLLTSDDTINYGNAVEQSTTTALKNAMGPAGFITNYKEYDDDACTGTTVECLSKEISTSIISGTTELHLGVTGKTAQDFRNCEFITLLFDNELKGSNDVISGATQSLVYKITDVIISTGTTLIGGVQTITGDTKLILDRTTPNLSSYTNSVSRIICNRCSLEYPEAPTGSTVCSPLPVDNLAQHDPWTLETIWTQKPAGLDASDEALSGYTGTQFSSLKEYLGYTSTGQTFTNLTGGTITNPTSYTNSFGEKIDVKPEDQRCIAVIHYSELGDITNDPERFFKYDDYIGSSTTEEYYTYDPDDLVSDVNHFEVYIPFIFYHRNTGTTIGAKFIMDTTDYYVSSAKNSKPNTNNLKFRFLLDEQNVRVGKVFVDKKIIVFDDQELVAVLEYKTNRKWTLPAPRFNTVPLDLPTFYDLDPVILTGETAWVTYMFQHTGDTYMNGMHCNYYGKITGTTNSNIGFRFETGDFKFLSNSSYFTGFTANKFYALVQVVQTGNPPSSDGWKIIDLTTQISGHTVGNLISKTNMCGYQFVITGDMYDSAITAPTYDIENYLGPLPNIDQPTLPQFGDSQPFPGAVQLTRATDVEILNFMVNLPGTQFLTSQNPTYATGQPKRITEVALLNENKEPLVTAKLAKPLERTGNQVFSVRIDF